MSEAAMQEASDIALSLMVGLDCPRSLTVAILIRYHEWDQIAQLSCESSHYLNAIDYADAVAATDFLRKFEPLPTSADRKAAAIEKWWWAERECYKTNRRLSSILDGSLRASAPMAIHEFFARARKICQTLIGPRPPTTFEGRFGPGATVSDSSRVCSIPDKMSSVPTFTPSSIGYLFPWAGTKWASACATLGKTPVSVNGNKFFTVPKTALTHRSCAKEPSINGYFQLGLGQVLRRQLKRVGIDLTSGQDVHRQVACQASRSGSYSTIDLSSASDCLSSGLVELLLPPQWFSALNSLRSSKTLIDGKWVRLEKFSSMGNGFTFELETLVFLVLALTCSSRLTPGVNVWVYGDDIIVPTNVSKRLLAVLRYSGFTPNLGKTFTTGPFRESCGGDFFDGEPVRAFYLKESPDEPQKLISLANGIRRLALANAGNSRRWSRLRRAWFGVLDRIPSQIRCCRGPEALGDLVIHDDLERWTTRWRSSIRYVRCYRPANYRKVMWDGFAYDVQFAAALYGVLWSHQGDRGSDKGRFLVPRDGVLGYKVGWVPFS